MINLIAAIDDKNGLANDRGIPWDLPSDKAYFEAKTLGGVIVMGYRTYVEFKAPLPKRINLVITDDDEPLRPGFIAIKTFDHLEDAYPGQQIWIIGGAGVFAQTINKVQELYLTRVKGDFNCTKFFPKFEENFFRRSQGTTLNNNGIEFNYEIWARKV